jgi:hypothetical protein
VSVYSGVNAYSPLVRSRLFDADVIFASLDNILKTPPRTRLFRPAGFDPEDYLFEMINAVGQDTRMQMLFRATATAEDTQNNTLQATLAIRVKGLTEETFYRTITINMRPR